MTCSVMVFTREPDAAAREAPGYPPPLVDDRAAMAEHRQRTRR